MDIKTALDIIIEDLDDVQKLIGNLKRIKEVPRLDLEMSLSKCRNIKEIMQMIQQLELYAPELEATGDQAGGAADTDSVDEKPNQEEQNSTDQAEYAATLQTEEPTEEQQGPMGQNASASGELKEEEERVRATEKQDRQETEPEKPVETQKSGKKAGQKKTEGPRVIGEKFSPKKGRNETLAGKMPRINLSSKLMEKPIRNIPSAIGINDKYTYIRELFDGDAAKYRETMEYLNNLTSWEDALLYINEHFDWDYESDVTRQLLVTIKRKLFVYE